MLKFLLLTGFSMLQPESPRDSIGIETINGKMFIIHRVAEKETLYGISRRYNVPVNQILEFNSTADAGLEIGQLLKVPYSPPVKGQSNEIIHKVAEKETLFSISRLYAVSVDDLKKWNNLTESNLSVGQELVIQKRPTDVPVSVPTEVQTARGIHTVAAKETQYSIAKKYGITVEQLRSWNNLTEGELKVGQTVFVSQPNYQASVTMSEPTPEKPIEPSTQITQPVITVTEPARSTDVLIESGLAELIEGTEANRKYLALHRSAPSGSILKVRNEMNNREVFVRVIGKLPDTALTDKLIIKISKSAYDRLGAIDPRFRVEVTFYK
jgi:LysM repeat protein